MATIQATLSDVLDNYSDYRKKPLKGNPLNQRFCHDFRDSLLVGLPSLANKAKYCVKGSIQQGRWCEIIWMMVSRTEITTTASKGIYVAYLVASDGSSCYLTLDQSATSVEKAGGDLQRATDDLRNKLGDLSPFAVDKPILGPDVGKRTRKDDYSDGCICYKKYERGHVPADSVLISDLQAMLTIYEHYVPSTPPLPVANGSVSEIEGKLISIEDYIERKGLQFPKGLIRNFYLCLKAKPFVILAGISGTGKTRLARLFAEAIGATRENGRFKLVPVRPDWSDSSELIGHRDLNDIFQPGLIADYLLAAANDPTEPYFLCLDEMNLARVEYYFSDVLSIMETRSFTSDKTHIVTDPLINPEALDSDSRKTYGGLMLPDNLYIIGTVNMDETTFPFSKKVLDRANMIEFSLINLSLPATAAGVASSRLSEDNTFLKSPYLTLKDCPSDDNLRAYCERLQKLNEILAISSSQVGYRVRDEICFYMVHNAQDHLLAENIAFDNALMQKVLPRIQGSSAKIRQMLYQFFDFCAPGFATTGVNEDSPELADKMDNYLMTSTLQYPTSARKIAFMVRRFIEDDITSYWL